jgi:hypothetical protein
MSKGVSICGDTLTTNLLLGPHSPRTTKTVRFSGVWGSHGAIDSPTDWLSKPHVLFSPQWRRDHSKCDPKKWQICVPKAAEKIKLLLANHIQELKTMKAE